MDNIGQPRSFSGAVKPDAISQDSYEPDLFAKRVVEIPSNMQLFSQNDSDGDPMYIGYATMGLGESQDGWLLQKITYDANKTISKRQIAYGNWTNRILYTYK